MKYFRKIFAVLLVLTMVFSFASCKDEPSQSGSEIENAPTVAPVQVSDPDRGEDKIRIAASEKDYVFRKLSIDRSYAYEITAKDVDSAKAADMLLKNQVSIASLNVDDAAKVASQADVRILAVTSEIRLSLITKGEEMRKIESLGGKTVYCGGKDTFVQTVTEKIFSDKGVGADLVFLSDSEVAAKIKNGEAGLFILQEPESIYAISQNADYSRAFEISGYWEEEFSPVSRCVVARADFVTANPELVKEFMTHIETCTNSLSTEMGAMSNATAFAQEGFFPASELTLNAINSTKHAYYEKEALKEIVSANFALAGSEAASVSDAVYYMG